MGGGWCRRTGVGSVRCGEGAGRGAIGFATAQHLAARGEQLILCGRNSVKGAEAANSITDAGGKAEFIQVDISQNADAEALVKLIVNKYGRLDKAFNNAGLTAPVAPLADSDPDAWRRVIDVNLSGTYYAMRAQIRAMRETGGGAIVNNSSLAGVTASYVTGAVFPIDEGTSAGKF